MTFVNIIIIVLFNLNYFSIQNNFNLSKRFAFLFFFCIQKELVKVHHFILKKVSKLHLQIKILNGNKKYLKKKEIFLSIDSF